MTELNKRLDRFTAAVLSEAVSESENTLREIGEKRKEALSAAEEQALNEAYQYVRGEVARIKTEKGRELSRRMLANKRALALRREEISRDVFEKVARRVVEYTAGPEYGSRLAALFQQAAETIGDGDLVVYLREQDLSYESVIRQAAGRRGLEIRTGAFRLGGLIVDCPVKNLRADQTFDSSLNGLDGHFAELFGLSLPSDNEPEGK